jgi:hypothetical protein
MTGFRMLATREFGWLVPLEASADPVLDNVRIELIDAMHCWEEDRHCASWMDDTSWWIWECIHTPAAVDRPRMYCSGIEPTDDERARLRSLAERAGGWWFRPAVQKSAGRCPCVECAVEEVFEHDGVIFVPLDVWVAAVALNDERAAERLILHRTRGAG